MTELSQDRPTGRAIRRGFCLRCPRCGRGALLRKYLKLRDHCDSCGMDFTPSRADDGPAYLTILVVGHLMAPLLHLAFVTFRPDPLTLALSFSGGCIALSLVLLPRMKGLVVGVQWARRMHGFGNAGA